MKRCFGLFAAVGVLAVSSAALADGPYTPAPSAPVPSAWQMSFSVYGWIPWINGTVGVRGRNMDLEVTPKQIFGNLDWSGVPAWMSYTELRRGPLFFFNDIVYAQVAGAGGFAKSVNGRLISATAGAAFEADYSQAVVELGGGMQVWSGPGIIPAPAALDVLAGARYWRQEFDASVHVNASVLLSGPAGIGDLQRSGDRVFAKSGVIDWVDPFVGLRLRQQVSKGQEVVVRGDIGGFGVGSDLTWQAMATYNMNVMIRSGYTVDAYVGYRALSVDYTQGSGATRYQYNAVQQGPIIGMNVKF